MTAVPQLSEVDSEGDEGGLEPFLVDALDEVDQVRARQAAVVRDYLVTLRGGSPFLSSADGRLLLRWLDGGTPVVAILAALDRAADRRLKRRSKRPLSLQACKVELKPAPLAAGGLGDRAAGPDPMLAYVEALRAQRVAGPFEAAHQQLISALLALPVSMGSPEERATAGVVLVREFHEAVWIGCDERPALRAEVADGYASLRGSLPDSLIEGLVEEATRDRLRRRFPLVSARELWDRLLADTDTADRRGSPP